MNDKELHAIQAAIDHAIVTHGLLMEPIRKNIRTVARNNNIPISDILIGREMVTGKYIAKVITPDDHHVFTIF